MTIERPFNNISKDPFQEYFSDGLTEQIINGLCKVSNLFVIARNSGLAYKVKPISIKQIAKELGVRYILEGSVQKAGDRVRITVQLIDATTDYHMWSENFDRDQSDIYKKATILVALYGFSVIMDLNNRGPACRQWGDFFLKEQSIFLMLHPPVKDFQNNLEGGYNSWLME